MTNNISQFKAKKGQLVWINIINAQKKELNYLKKKFKFNELDLADSLAAKYAQRPKFFERSNYCFLILQFPVYSSKTREIVPEEIDFFIGRDYLITLHKNNLKPMIELANSCASDPFYCEQYLDGTNASFLYEIISRLQEYCFPILDHISLDVERAEQNIFVGHERRMVTEILYTKRNILNFRKIIEAHKSAIQHLAGEKTKFLNAEKMKIYYHDLIEHTKSIWEILQNQKETIEALEDTNTSLLTFKLNDIMRTLTIFSVVVFPLTLLASIFGMNAVNGMPFINDPNGFWMVIGIMLCGALIMFLFFKRKKWL
ncbi:MAG: magnesium transporter CorA family protein [Patescibacteria group bacterium]